MTPTQNAPNRVANPAADRYDAVIVGAGFAGMYMLHKLRQLGFTARVYDTAAGFGGTWYWNRYPGARCDIMSIDYSFSFDKDLEQDWEWKEKYATQPEILSYANHVADRFNLWPDVQFETRIDSAAFDMRSRRWTITTDRGEEVSAQHMVLATGCLSASKKPEIDGIENFEGATYETSHWPHEGVDFTGQRVAVIGTGSSAIQSIPIIAKQADRLTVFQRTPNFSMPARNKAFESAFIADLKARYPEYRQAARESFFGVPQADDEPAMALEVDPSERQKTYQAGWEAGSLIGVLGAYGDLLYDKRANDTAADFVRAKIRELVEDPELADTMSPKDYPFGTKRPCLDTDYFVTFNRPNVRLVDLRKTPFTRMTATGIETTAESFEFDSIVYATGFDAMTGAITRIDIKGLGGQGLKERWEHGPTTYLGLCMAGFPNLFAITGPGSPSVLSNMMVSIEQHVEWIADCVTYMRDNGFDTIEATEEAEQAWTEHVVEIGNTTLYPLANSWYMGANVPGKTQVFLPYIGGVGAYRQKCDEVAAAGYQGFILSC